MKINHGLIAVSLNETEQCFEILHFCGYEKEPTQVEIDDLKRELAENPEFGLSNRTDYIIHRAAPEIVEHFKGEVNEESLAGEE